MIDVDKDRVVQFFGIGSVKSSGFPGQREEIALALIARDICSDGNRVPLLLEPHKVECRQRTAGKLREPYSHRERALSGSRA